MGDRTNTLAIMAAILSTRLTNNSTAIAPQYTTPDNCARLAHQLLAAVEKVQSEVEASRQQREARTDRP